MTHHILMFSDVHGRIPLLVKLVSLFQTFRRVEVDLVLITGDLGVFPDLRRLDSSTKKYSRTEPLELGFQALQSLLEPQEHTQMLTSAKATFFQDKLHQSAQASYKQLLSEQLAQLRCPFVFIGGNHEDYDYLARCREQHSEPKQALIPVEETGRWCWLPSGGRFSLGGCRIAGVDGIEPAASGRSASRYPPEMCLTEDNILQRMLELQGQPIDILLTHDGPPDAALPGKGSPLVELLLQELQPRTHWFGHYHTETQPTDYAACYEGINSTFGYHLNKLAFSKSGGLRRHAMGHVIVEEGGGLVCQYVEDDWLQHVTERSWLHYKPKPSHLMRQGMGKI